VPLRCRNHNGPRWPGRPGGREVRRGTRGGGRALTVDREPESARRCGDCTLCCTVLRVDPLAKLGGIPCSQLADPAEGGGCAIHATRPAVCRAYRCLWLQGGLEEAERPDRLGAIVDLRPSAEGVRLSIRQAAPGAFDASPALQAVAARYRAGGPVEITDPDDPWSAERVHRVLWPDGSETRAAGERVEVWRDGELREVRRAPALERMLQRLRVAWQRRRLERRLRRARPPWDTHARQGLEGRQQRATSGGRLPRRYAAGPEEGSDGV